MAPESAPLKLSPFRPDPQRRSSDRRRSRPHLRLVEPGDELHPVLTRRDPNTVRRLYPVMSAIADRYYRGEVEGAEHLSDQASLMVATHNGSLFTPDAYCQILAFWRRFGLETPFYMLAHKIVGQLPGFGQLARGIGAIPANWDNARIALRSGFPTMVCPGGDADSLKPFSRRHQLHFGKRRGFIKLAIQEQVPIVPMVSVGAHEALYVLPGGPRIARALRLDRILRLKSVPLALGFPLGLTVAGVGAVPLPTKVKVRILPPISPDMPAEAADDPQAVEAMFRRVQTAMQAALDQLAAARRWPILG